MRLVRLTTALLVFSAVLSAAGSFVGTWKLNPGKSSFQSGQPAKEEAITIEERGEQYDVTIRGVAADGSPISSRYTVPISSGKGSVIESSTYDAVSTKRISATTRQITYYIGGKKVMVVTAVVSRNGKTLRADMRGIGALGQRVQGTTVFDRQ